jgi:hypothetical protein
MCWSSGHRDEQRGKQGAAVLRRDKKLGLGAEEDGFALKHFDGDEERGGGVDAGGKED